MVTYLNVGGLVAAGFDQSGNYLLTISHAGRGVFAVNTWQRVARDAASAYPTKGCALGIGPIEGQTVQVTELDYKTGQLHVQSQNGLYHVAYESGTISITRGSA